jgi:hypothetical protein
MKKRVAGTIMAALFLLFGPSVSMAQEEAAEGSTGSGDAEEEVDEDFESDDFSDFSDIEEIIAENGDDVSSSDSTDGEERKLDTGGRVRFDTRFSVDKASLGDSDISVYPWATLNFIYQNKNSDLFMALDFNRNILFNHLDNLIDEAYVRLYYNRFNLEIGYQKVVWGPGDETHVIDVLTPMDYTDFVNQDYLDRKEAEAMFKLNWKFTSGSLLELVYQPVFAPDTYPLEGPWIPYSLEQFILSLPGGAADIIYPNTNTFKYGQFAVRWSKAPGRLDLGALYYYGYFREPSVDYQRLMVETKAYISWDRVHFIGGDLGTVLWGFNTWLEFGYYFTDDWTGEDPIVHNHHWVLLFGFDRSLGLSNLNFEFQLHGDYTMHSDRIGPGDTEYNSKGKYTDDILIFALRDSYVREKVRPVLSVAYTVEKGDYIIWPEIEFSLRDDMLMSVMYLEYGGDLDTYFGQFDDNDFLEIRFEYKF